MIRKALFSGSFDPFTIGHDAIVQRGLALFDELIVAVAINSEKKTLFSLDDRLNVLKQLYEHENRISVSSYANLTVDYALQCGVHYILRGVRHIIDFEYEKNMASMNKKMAGIETVFLFAEPEFAFISSTLIRDLIYHQKDISHLIPQIK